MWTLVTGGTRGIGRAICEFLKTEEENVIAVYHQNTQQARQFSQETGIPTASWDVSELEACQKGVQNLTNQYGAITRLVNNAGITRDALFENMTLDQWQDVMRNNVDSLFSMTKALWPTMKKSGGSIVNVSSVNGVQGQKGQTNYCTSKAASLGFTKALAQEGAPYDIVVNAVAPGYTDTDMVKSVPAKILDKIIRRIPMGRLGKSCEVARMVGFLLTSNYITGATFHVNGGQWMG